MPVLSSPTAAPQKSRRGSITIEDLVAEDVLEQAYA
jgi:hypothetical protein